jgi:predicted lipoprotein with Yx(FWY)xxD motif
MTKLSIMTVLAVLALALVVPAMALAQQAPVTVKTARIALGEYLVDGQGKTLYLFTRDDAKTSLSACISPACLAAWPLLATTDKPVAGEGVDAKLLGTVKHPNGTTMATYNGWPLYYYTPDKAPGEILGQGRSDGTWWVVSPKGEIAGKGPIGAAGAAGPVGDRGAVGAAGLAGAAGAAGAKGARGDTGKVGATGPAGAKGAAGAAGAAGPKGGPGGLNIIGIIVALVAVGVVGLAFLKGRQPAAS